MSSIYRNQYQSYRTMDKDTVTVTDLYRVIYTYQSDDWNISLDISPIVLVDKYQTRSVNISVVWSYNMQPLSSFLNLDTRLILVQIRSRYISSSRRYIAQICFKLYVKSLIKRYLYCPRGVEHCSSSQSFSGRPNVTKHFNFSAHMITMECNNLCI